MPFNPADPNYQELLKSVLHAGSGSQMGVVPFVGAGLSVYGKADQRLPLWRELLEGLLADGQQRGLVAGAASAAIELEIESGDFVDAAQRLFESLGEPNFRRTVERELDDSNKPIPPSISKLVTIGWPLIVTTNLDRLIARAYYETHGRPVKIIYNLDTEKLGEAVGGSLVSDETALAKIHGDIDLYRSWRLTRAHYTEAMEDSAYVQAIKSLFLRQVLFVGFGLKDEDFDPLIATMAEIFPAGTGKYYALVARSRSQNPVVQRLMRDTDLRPIFYDVDPDPHPSDPYNGHRAVHECLEHLAVTWAASTTDLDVTLKYFPELDPNMVGRDQDIARLTQLVEGRGCIVQVIGLGGLGKTSLVQQYLALERAGLVEAGYGNVFGCSFYRSDIGQFIQDMALATVGPGAFSLPEQVDRICEYVQQHRTLLVLDGLEAILDSGSKLSSPYVLQILKSVLQGQGTGVITSRVPVRGGPFDGSPVIEVKSLSEEQIKEFLGQWGLDRLGEAANQRLVEITAGHPLAMRILAGVLQEVPAEDAIATIESSAVIDVADEVDPLRENRLARILGSYFPHLDEAEVAFLDCSTAFEGPAPYLLLDAALTRSYSDTSVNAPLVGRDLRQIVGGLLERRLLAISAGGELTSHPTVQEYFGRRARQGGEPLGPIHRYLAEENLKGAVPLPATFEEASPLIAACRHAAAYGDWVLFDELFRRRLMRGVRDYLCETLGAWEEALDLARLARNAEFPAELRIKPGYYPITVARCLKHLGRSTESRAEYLASLRSIAYAKDPDTAMYVNNCLTLLVWRGELTAADQLVELNIRALSWIAEPWRYRWQVEHGFSSIAYLRLLQGEIEAATELFDRSERAWLGFVGEQPWNYDYYPLYRSEAVLLVDPDAHGAALAGVEALLAAAESRRLPEPESICRGHIQAAVVLLDRASRRGDIADLRKATERLDRAREIAAGMNLADVAIAHHLARLKVELVRSELPDRAGIELAAFGDLINRADLLIESSGLALAWPEVIAARGALAYLEGSQEQARKAYERGLSLCREQGNALAPISPRSLLNWLGRSLGIDSDHQATSPTIDPVELVGAELSSNWMIESLNELPPPARLSG